MNYKKNNRIYPIISLFLLSFLLFISCNKSPKQEPPIPDPHSQIISPKTILPDGVEYWTGYPERSRNPGSGSRSKIWQTLCSVNRRHSGRDYRGTFIFIDPGIGEKNFVAANQESLDIINKGDDVTITITRNFGTLSVVVKTAGQLYLGDKLVATVPQASTVTLEKVVAGEYTVAMQYEDGEKETHRVVVVKDKTVRLEFQYVPGKQDKADVPFIPDDTDESFHQHQPVWYKHLTGCCFYCIGDWKGGVFIYICA